MKTDKKELWYKITNITVIKSDKFRDCSYSSKKIILPQFLEIIETKSIATFKEMVLID